MKVIISARASADLITIGDHIALNSRARARSFVQDLRGACMTLRGAPLRYGLLDGFEAQGLRRRPFGNYVIIYRADHDAITILRILHAAQDMDRNL